jgi:hypothetical protein
MMNWKNVKWKNHARFKALPQHLPEVTENHE